MTKIEAYQTAERLGAGFLANVILQHHRNPAQKLRGLVKLLRYSHTVRVGQFSIDTLVVDGQQAPWSILEDAGR